MHASELNNQAAKLMFICSNSLCISRLGFLGLQTADQVSYLIRKQPTKRYPENLKLRVLLQSGKKNAPCCISLAPDFQIASSACPLCFFLLPPPQGIWYDWSLFKGGKKKNISKSEN